MIKFYLSLTKTWFANSNYRSATGILPERTSDLFYSSPIRDIFCYVRRSPQIRRNCRGNSSVLNCVCAFRPSNPWIPAYKGFTLLRYSSDRIVKTNIFWFLVRLENIYGDFPNYIYDSVNLNIAVKYILKNWNGQYVSFAPGRYLIFGKLMLL